MIGMRYREIRGKKRWGGGEIKYDNKEEKTDK